MSYDGFAQAALSRWRAIELQLENLNPMTPEADELKLESYRLRNEYQDLIEQAIAPHAEPTVWPQLGGHEFGLAEA